MCESYEDKVEIPSTNYSAILKVRNVSGENDAKIYIPSEELLLKHPAFLYDRSSGNVHLHPPIQDAIRYSEEINQKLIMVREKLVDEITARGKNKECIIRRVSSRMYKNTDYESASHLFDYVSVKYKGEIYQIMCTSFNKDSEKLLVIETIKSFQFIKSSNYYSIDYYPEDGKIAEESIPLLYKNADATFDNVDAVVQEFANFIGL